jgi:hypothetical protein
LESLCAQRLDPLLLQPNQSGDNSRQRIYTPKLTFLAFLDQTLDPDSSCRSAVDQILAYYQGLPHPPQIDTDTSAYCQARARWTAEELIDIRRALAQGPAFHGETLFPGFQGQGSLKVLDGTCFNLPDTAANRQLYPPSSDQKPGCGFPLVRLVGVFCLKTGVLLEQACAPYATSENKLFHDLWSTFCPGDLLVADRNFCSYGALAGLQLFHQTDSLFHLHASRNSDFRKGLRLGPRDRLVTWTKPANKPANIAPQLWQQLPATLTVRLVRVRLTSANSRCRTITLVTTLTDPKLWPLKRLAALYHRRWKIELYWDDIKTALQMDMLSCKTPAMVHKEIQMHLIAYNLIRAIMCEAALVANVPLERVSFTGTRDAAYQYSHAIARIPIGQQKRRRTLYAQMLATIASELVPERPDRREPRCQKRRPKAYPFMTQPRHLMKDAPKRSRAKKTRNSLS